MVDRPLGCRFIACRAERATVHYVSALQTGLLQSGLERLQILKARGALVLALRL